jgi:hypothetical protein
VLLLMLTRTLHGSLHSRMSNVSDARSFGCTGAGSGSTG